MKGYHHLFAYAALGAALLLATLLLMDRAGHWWWAWAWGLWLLVMLIMAWAWPAFIAPLFNRFLPLDDAALRVRVEALLARCGFSAGGGVFPRTLKSIPLTHEIKTLLDPTAYTGLCADMAREGAARARAVAAELAE